MNVVAGALAIAVGVSALVSGIRLLITRRKLLF
jgi:ascorbate-specific PTS system EIIC-type component UlaA